MARRYKSLHHNLQPGQNVVFHREHRSKRGRMKNRVLGMAPAVPRNGKKGSWWKRPHNKKRMQTQKEPSKKELRAVRKETRKQIEAEIQRVRMNILANRPKWLPRFLWVRIVAIVLEPGRGQAGE